MNESSKGELVTAMNVLVTRRRNTVDPAEKAAINEALIELSGWIQDIDQASLRVAAQIVADATDALERVVGSARQGPFDNYLADIQGVIRRLQQQQAAMHAIDRLPPAVTAVAPVPAPVSPVPPSLPAGTEVVMPATPINSTAFAELRGEYQADFDRCEPLQHNTSDIDFYVARLLRFRAVYADLGDALGIPWFFIGILHGMECGFDFGTHLHNGDSLTRRTVHAPRRRPVEGTPPFTWRDSARDALILKHYDSQDDWSLPRILHRFEAYNGFGYRPLGVPSPYLWSFSNLCTRGKFVADGLFDAEAVSKQCGTAVMLKALRQRGAA